MNDKPNLMQHRYVERARQRLVRLEESYLKAHGWTSVELGGVWFWQKQLLGGTRMVMHRTDAASFQHNLLED